MPDKEEIDRTFSNFFSSRRYEELCKEGPWGTWRVLEAKEQLVKYTLEKLWAHLRAATKGDSPFRKRTASEFSWITGLPIEVFSGEPDPDRIYYDPDQEAHGYSFLEKHLQDLSGRDMESMLLELCKPGYAPPGDPQLDPSGNPQDLLEHLFVAKLFLSYLRELHLRCRKSWPLTALGDIFRSMLCIDLSIAKAVSAAEQICSGIPREEFQAKRQKGKAKIKERGIQAVVEVFDEDFAIDEFNMSGLCDEVRDRIQKNYASKSDEEKKNYLPSGKIPGKSTIRRFILEEPAAHAVKERCKEAGLL